MWRVTNLLLDVNELVVHIPSSRENRSTLKILAPNWDLSTANLTWSLSVLYWLSYSTEKFIFCVLPGPLQWFFDFGEEFVMAWTHIGWVRWMFQNPPLPAAQEVRDNSSGVTTVPPSVVVFSWVLDDYNFFTKVKEPLWGTQYNARDELCYRADNTEHQTKIDVLMVYDIFQTFGKRW